MDTHYEKRKSSVNTGSDGPDSEMRWLRVRVAPCGSDLNILLTKQDSILSLKREITACLSAVKTDSYISLSGFSDVPPVRQRIFLRGAELENHSQLDGLPESYWAQDYPSSCDRKKRPDPIQAFLMKRK